jgi:hypothetical protein
LPLRSRAPFDGAPFVALTRNGELDQRYTLGAEEEVMLLDPSRWLLAQPADRVVAASAEN